MRPELRHAIQIEEFDYNLLKHVLAGYKNPRVKIHDLIKKGSIIRVKKGVYVFGPALARGPYSKETLANLIYGPSYISLEYALYFYGMIPENIETITSITSKRNRYFKTPVGDFSYRYVHPSLYPCGITMHEVDSYHSIIIATKEKALSDILYFENNMRNEPQLERYLVEDMRMDRNDIRKLSVSRVRHLARLYGNNVSVLYNFLRRIR